MTCHRLPATGFPPLPAFGYLRLPHIVGDSGDPTANPPKPPIPAIIPISKSAWWADVKDGRFPKPVKIGPNTTAWRVEDIKALVEQLAG
jgi:hypothetical protein